MFYGNEPNLYLMKTRFLSFHTNRGIGTVAALLLAAGVACLPDATQAKPKEKPTPTPAPSPSATPSATPMPTASNSAATANYTGEQQGHYQGLARDAFITQRSAKSQPFIDAFNAFDAAGGVSAKGLKTKEDIAARRDLLAKTIAANDDYLEFARNEEYLYRTELDKTQLVQGDVDGMVKQFTDRTNVAMTIKLRETETAALKAGDSILAFLESRIGAWSISDAGSIKFKKPADVGTMNTLNKKYTALETELLDEQKQIQAAAASPSPSPSPGATPGASPAAVPGAAPSVSVTPAPAPSATASPAPSVKK